MKPLKKNVIFEKKVVSNVSNEIEKKMSINVNSCDADSFWNWGRSGSSGPVGIILEEDCTTLDGEGLGVQRSDQRIPDDRSGLSVAEKIEIKNIEAKEIDDPKIGDRKIHVTAIGDQKTGEPKIGDLKIDVTKVNDRKIGDKKIVTSPVCRLRCRDSDNSIADESSRDEDDPYEYDEDIPRRPFLIYERRNGDSANIEEGSIFDNSIRDIDIVAGSSNREEDIFVASGASTSSAITPCWGCKGCDPGTPLFVLGSPADLPSTCISCQ